MKNHHRLLTVSIALVSCIAVVALVLELCHDPLIPVKPRNLEITEMYMVEDQNGEPVIFLTYDQSSSHYTHTGDVNIITMRNGRITLTIKSKVSLLEFLNPTPTVSPSAGALMSWSSILEFLMTKRLKTENATFPGGIFSNSDDLSF